MADEPFLALDANGLPKSFAADKVADVYTPYRKNFPADQAALMNALTGIFNVSGGANVVPVVRDTALAPAVADDVFPGGATPVAIRFRNIGPADAYYNVGAAAVAVFGDGNRQLNVGESVTLPYRTALNVSMISTDGTNIEAEEWS